MLALPTASNPIVGKTIIAMGREEAPPWPRRENACSRVGSINGLSALKRRELVECFERRMLDVMVVQEAYRKGCGLYDGERE